MDLETKINAILAETTDTLLGLNANALSLKTVVNEENQTIAINLCAGIPRGFLQEHYLPTITAALEKQFPEYRLDISLDHFIKAHRTQLPGSSLRGIKNTIAIASGKGGVGKSTVAVNLAIALANAGARVGVLDADIYGPSIPLMLGEHSPVEVSGDRYLPVKAHGIYAMSIGYLTPDEPALIWRGPMLAKSLLQMIDITQWDELDYLLIDLPPGTGDIQLSLVQKIPLTGAVVVTTPQNVATLDAEKAIKMFNKTNIEVLGVVENMALYHCPRCEHEEAIFGSGGAQRLSDHYGCKLLGQLPLNTNIREHCDQGKPTASQSASALSIPFIKAAMQLSIEVSKKPLNYADRFPPIVSE